MELEEHIQIVVTSPITGDGREKPEPGDVGVVVHIHPGEAAFVAEFVTLGSSTYVIASVLPAQARNVATKDVIHAREFALAE